MSRLAILVTVQVFVGCLFVGVSPAEDVRPQKTLLSKSDALILTRPTDRQIIIRTQLVEVSLSKMKRLGIDISTIDGMMVQVFDGDEVIVGMKSSGSYFAMMETLTKNGIARVLADPTIATMDRRRASISLGSTIEVGNRPNVDNESETEFIGTKLEVVPQVVDNRRLNIELHLDWSGIDDSNNTHRRAKPNIRYYKIDTMIEATFGETFVLGGLVRKARDGDEITLVLMVTPEWADGNQADKKKSLHVSQAPQSDLQKK